MSKLYEQIDEQLAVFIRQQHVFFVATAPLAQDGHINLSPKGLDVLRILDRRTVAYLDLVGSGVETVAQLQENGRIVIMFCAFDGPPKIVRLHGHGEVIEPADPRFSELRHHFPELPGVRCIVRVQCNRISDSCGLAVPRFEYRGERLELLEWASNQSIGKLRDYQQRKNRTSIDGLPGIALPQVEEP